MQEAKQMLARSFSLLKKRRYLFVLAVILISAALLRFYQLDKIPPGLYPDEAINARQAALEPGKIFYIENNGREGLFINLLYFGFSLFGVSVASARMVSAFFGTLTVLGIYLLVKEVFLFLPYKKINPELAGLFSAFFLAFSFWHINFSRIIFRAVLAPFFLVFGFYFFFLALKAKKVWLAGVGGLFFGLGFHTYISYRFGIFLLPLVFSWAFIYLAKPLKKFFWLVVGFFLGGAFLGGLPIGLYFLKNPGDFFGRSSGVSVFKSSAPLFAFFESLVRHLAMFNIYGDGNWRHNISGLPVLFWPVGILFLIGFFHSLRETIASFKEKDFKVFFPFAFFLSWWFLMLLPGILTYEGIPHSLRTVIAVIPVMAFAAVGACLSFVWLEKIIKKRVAKTPLSLWLLSISIFLLAGSFALTQYWRYFQLWGSNLYTARAFSYDLVNVGEILNELPEESLKFVIVNMGGVQVDGIPMPAQTPMFVETARHNRPRARYFVPVGNDFFAYQTKADGSIEWEYLTEAVEKRELGQEVIVVFLQERKEDFTNLVKFFPYGEIEFLKGIWVYRFK